MDPYPARRRDRNIQLLEGLANAADQARFDAACEAIAGDFHPSLLSEIDWQSARNIGTGRPPLTDLGAFVFVLTLDQNLDLRAGQLGLEPDRRDRVHRFLAATREIDLDALTAVLVDAAGEETDRYVRDRFETIRAAAVRELAELQDAERVPLILTTHLSNAHLLLLDQPVTRLAAVGLRGGEYLTWPSLEGAGETRAWLGDLAADADDRGLAALGVLARQLRDEVDWPDILRRHDFDGDRAGGTGPCGRCAMSFSGEALVSIDPRCRFFSRFGPGTIFIPAGLNVSRCQFCGHEATVEIPAMCYIPHRAQAIYCVPTHRRIGREEAIDLYGSIIEGVRSRYTQSLDERQRADFDASAELVTESWDEFLNAIHMGETVDEDHVYNLVVVGDGTGILADVSKGFYRELSVAEMQRRDVG